MVGPISSPKGHAMPSRYLDPKIDLAFKRVFGEHKNLLKSFLRPCCPWQTMARFKAWTT